MTRRDLEQAIAVWRQKVLGCSQVLDDKRHAVDEAEFELDRTAAHLAGLIAWHQELEAL